MKNIIKTLIVPLLIILIRPLGLSLNQSIVLASLILTISWWTVGVVKKSYASLFLLGMFTIFGNTPLTQIFNFPLSEIFIIIIFAYIFSQGISNSKLAQKLLEPYLYKYGNSYIKLMVIILILQFLMIFIIPQPFSRIIILSIIIREFFKGINLNQKTQSTLMFWLHTSSVFINMTMIKGDLILNNALLSIANIEMAEATWIQYMMLPAFVFYIVSAVGFVLTFKKDLDQYNQCEKSLKVKSESLSKKDKINVFIIAVTVVLWATETIHGIPGTGVVILGTAAMFVNKLLKMEDLKCIDVNLLMFLTAAFSIGRVMSYSGTSDVIFSNLTSSFPGEFNLIYIFMIVLISMALHMILGSNVTTLSVVLPGVLLISRGIVNPVTVMFITYVAVCAHYLLPFHSVIILIGNGNKLFSSKKTMKFSPVLTLIVVFSIFLIYRTWWMLIGVL